MYITEALPFQRRWNISEQMYCLFLVQLQYVWPGIPSNLQFLSFTRFTTEEPRFTKNEPARSSMVVQDFIRLQTTNGSQIFFPAYATRCGFFIFKLQCYSSQFKSPVFCLNVVMIGLLIYYCDLNSRRLIENILMEQSIAMLFLGF